MFKTIAIAGIFCLAGMALFTDIFADAENSSGKLAIMPDTVEIGTFYNGTDIRITAEVPMCDGAVLVMTAGDEEIELNRKGRVAGIWLNTAEVTADSVPGVYIMAASNDLDNFCGPELCRELGLGLDYLHDQIKFASNEGLTGTEFDELIKLKKHNGTYKMDIGIDLVPGDSASLELTAILPIAPTVPPGRYAVSLYCIEQNQLIEDETGTLTLKRVGLSRMMVNLAHKHAALYGIIAVAVAMAVGIIMGVIFDSLPGSGH